jgi:hypothetical protein
MVLILREHARTKVNRFHHASRCQDAQHRVEVRFIRDNCGIQGNRQVFGCVYLNVEALWISRKNVITVEPLVEHISKILFQNTVLKADRQTCTCLKSQFFLEFVNYHRSQHIQCLVRKWVCLFVKNVLIVICSARLFRYPLGSTPQHSPWTAQPSPGYRS